MNVVVEGEREGQNYSLLKKRKGQSKLNGECSTFYQKCLMRTICRGITTLLTVAIFSLRHIPIITFKKDPSNTPSGSGLKTPTWRNTLSRLWNTIWKNLSQNVKKILQGSKHLYQDIMTWTRSVLIPRALCQDIPVYTPICFAISACNQFQVVLITVGRYAQTTTTLCAWRV